MSKVSIVISVKDALYYVKKCLESVMKYTTNYELIIIDNNSKEETKAFLKNIDYLDYTLITNKENKGTPYGRNQGIKIAKSNYICFLDSDTIVTPNWLDKLMKCFKVNKDCGICGSTTSFCRGSQCDKRVMKSRFTMTTEQINQFASNLKEGYQQQEVIGFCFIVKNEVFKKVGVFDHKRFKLGNVEEREFMWRAEKLGNYKSYWVKGAYVHHFGHITFKEIGINPSTYNQEARREWERNKHSVKPKFIENDVIIENIKKIRARNEKK